MQKKGLAVALLASSEEGMMPGGPLQDPSSAFRSSIFIHFYDNPFRKMLENLLGL